MSVDKIKSNFQTFGSSIKNTVKHHREFNNDDELISHYEHDIKVAIKALKFLSSQINKLATSHWPRVFKTNLKVSSQFLQLIGENSLHFDGIEKYYDEFDKIQAEEEIPSIHPKEKQFLIPSVFHELCNYVSSMEQLQDKIIKESEWHASSVKLRVTEMSKYLRDILKLIKKRNNKKNHYDKIHKKISKLMKKTTPLDEKEQKELNTLDIALKEASSIYTKLDDKLKAILPHALSFLDEFVDSIGKIVVCKQLDLYKEIDSTLKYFSIFHGFTNLKYRDESDGLIQSYEAIVTQWESNMTPTRLQLESFITIIHDKNPDLLDESIDDELKTKKTEKIWNKMTSKMNDKKHQIKAKDTANGIFNDYLEADPLESFLNYQNPNYNRSETYHPTKIVNASEVHLPVNNLPPPPPLPPRSNTSGMLKALPVVPASQVSTPLPPLPNRNNSLPPTPRSNLKRSGSIDSFESVNSSDSSSSSIISDYDSEILSTVASKVLLDNSSPDVVNKHISKAYNSAKNDIKAAPITSTDPIYNKINPNESLIFNKTSSISYKIDQYNKFFDKVLSLSNNVAVERRKVVAKYDFRGAEPGDLSFKKGDTLEILFDFQLVDTLYSRDNNNWMIGLAGSRTAPRIGFIPNNYF